MKKKENGTTKEIASQKYQQIEITDQSLTQASAKPNQLPKHNNIESKEVEVNGIEAVKRTEIKNTTVISSSNYKTGDVKENSYYDEYQIIKVWDAFIQQKQLHYFCGTEKGHIDVLVQEEKGIYKFSALIESGLLVTKENQLYLNHSNLSVSICNGVDGTLAQDQILALIKFSMGNALIQIKDWNDAQKVKIQEHVIIFPYQAIPRHWHLGLLFLQFNKSCHLKDAKITDYNPNGQSGCAIKGMVKNVIQNLLKIKWDSVDLTMDSRKHLQQQHDGSSCGVITAENGKDYIDGNPEKKRMSCVYKPGASALRLCHLNEVNSESFKLWQNHLYVYDPKGDSVELINYAEVSKKLSEALQCLEEHSTSQFFSAFRLFTRYSNNINYTPFIEADKSALRKIIGGKAYEKEINESITKLDQESAIVTSVLRFLFLEYQNHFKQNLLFETNLFDLFFYYDPKNQGCSYKAGSHGFFEKFTKSYQTYGMIPAKSGPTSPPEQSVSSSSSLADSIQLSMRSNSESNPRDIPSNWLLPLTINDMLPSGMPQKMYTMTHLLASGFKGIEYQLLVFLARLMELYSDNKNFEAGVEFDAVGNLDDVVLVIKEKDRVVELEAYQIKYYNHPICANDFYNEPKKKAKEKNETEKMHIGKFLDGWLAWRAKYPDLSLKKLHSIVYSNAALDRTLSQCIVKGHFRSEFIQHEKKFFVGRQRSKKIGEVTKNFLTKLENKGISDHYSKQVWNELKRKRFISETKYLTREFTPDKADFTIQLGSLPSGITSKEVIQFLKENYYEPYQENQTDFYEILYDQSWKYLESERKHGEFLAKLTDQEKQTLFQQFLNSFQFHMNKKDIASLEIEIQQKIFQILETPPDQIYLCLYYAIREWFRRDNYKNKQVTLFTNEIMKILLEEAVIRSQDSLLLQGRSAATLARFSYHCEGRTVRRDELISLTQALNRPSLVLVVGEKGIGKSGLIKQVLEKQHPASYIVLSATEVVKDSSLRDQISKVLSKMSTFRIVFIDSAEFLLDLPDYRKWLSSLRSFDRTVMLSTTPEARQQLILDDNTITVHLVPLSIDNIIHSFPELRHYQHIASFMRLAQIPFYLSVMMRLIHQMEGDEFKYLFGVQNAVLEAELIKLIVSGTSTMNVKSRRLAWQQLAVKLACSNKGLNEGIRLPSVSEGLEALLKEKIVLQQDGRYYFCHDLFFEYGLMVFWFQKWKMSYIQGKTAVFWYKLSRYLVAYKTRFILEKWFRLYEKQLLDDLIAYSTEISQAN